MSKHTTDEKIKKEVTYAIEHFHELYVQQSAEREATVNDPANAEFLAECRQKRKIAEALYEARKKAKLTQAELAEKMNVSQPYVVQLEQGKRFSFSAVSKYAKACGKRAAIIIV